MSALEKSEDGGSGFVFNYSSPWAEVVLRLSALEKSEDGGGGGVQGAQAESQGAPQLEGGERGGETTDQSIF